MKELENLIEKKIRSVYSKRLIAPLIYIVILVLIWLFTPVRSYVLPVHYDSVAAAIKVESAKNRCVEITLENLKFTGYIQTRFNVTSGYYYYTIVEDKCYLALLAPTACEEGNPQIDKIAVRAAVREVPDNVTAMYESIADTLGWSASGVQEIMPTVMFSQADISTIAGLLFMAFVVITGIFAVISAISFLVYIIVPYMSPTGRMLGLFGRRKRLLAQATEELATLPQLATEDIYITENFFIAFTNKSVTVLPISEIVWVYKHSTLHKFLWYHFSISYTLHIVANKHIYVQLPKNMKSDIDGIIDYLAEANHDILVGFDEKNRVTVQKTLGINRFWGGFLAFLNHRV